MKSSQRACERGCFRSGLGEMERRIGDRTCEQLVRAGLRGCPGCS